MIAFNNYSFEIRHSKKNNFTRNYPRIIVPSSFYKFGTVVEFLLKVCTQYKCGKGILTTSLIKEMI